MPVCRKETLVCAPGFEDIRKHLSTQVNAALQKYNELEPTLLEPLLAYARDKAKWLGWQLSLKAETKKWPNRAGLDVDLPLHSLLLFAVNLRGMVYQQMNQVVISLELELDKDLKGVGRTVINFSVQRGPWVLGSKSLLLANIELEESKKILTTAMKTAGLGPHVPVGRQEPDQGFVEFIEQRKHRKEKKELTQL